MSSDAVALTDQQRTVTDMVRHSTFRLSAIRLPDTRFLEVSDPLLALVGRSRSYLLRKRLFDDVADPEAVRQSLALLTTGKIDGYTRHGGYRLPDGGLLPVTLRVSAITDQVPRTDALAMVLDSTPEADDPVPRDVPDGEDRFALGTVDPEWRIDRLTSDVGSLLGHDASNLLGQSVFAVVHPEDMSQLLLLASQATACQAGVTGRLRLRDGNQSWVQCRVAVLPLSGGHPGGFAFALSRADGPPTLTTSRTRELEEHLRRIGREVTASGVAALGTTMPTALDVPELGALTSREYEILVRLAGGERVALVARRLFLSESTVRNHLTSVYRKFGVSSRGELLAYLQVHAPPVVTAQRAPQTGE